MIEPVVVSKPIVNYSNLPKMINSEEKCISTVHIFFQNYVCYWNSTMTCTLGFRQLGRGLLVNRETEADRLVSNERTTALSSAY
jgi:hypothetical protein